MNTSRLRTALFAGYLCLLANCGSGAQSLPATPSPSQPTLNSITLPADAAPPHQQVLVGLYPKDSPDNALDLFESVYTSFFDGSDMLSEPLVRINKNYKVVPGAATKWESNASATQWTFHLDPQLIWSDDTPLTAEDYVASFRYGADPKHNWDFAWYFNGTIKHWEEATSGKLPPEAIGVRAIDAHTIQIETIAPAPYLPSMLLYSAPLQKKALERYGSGKYNLDPATSVSCGPFVLKEWSKKQSFVLEANPKYRGNNKPYIQKFVLKSSTAPSALAAYLNGEINIIFGASLTADDEAVLANHPELAKDMHLNYGDFRIHYLFFDMQRPPFDNLKVRQAFSHAIERERLVKEVLKSTNGFPAYSYLMPGFPASNAEALKAIQNYDVAKAKQLLAEAGYPDGKGFPKLTLWVREETFLPVGQAIASAIAHQLGISIDVLAKSRAEFTSALNAKPTGIQFGFVPYGMDFLDPYNMLSVWMSGGRHTWNNPAFDQLVKKAGAFTGDPDERTRMFQQAERMLVEDVAGVFIFHQTTVQFYRPYIAGSEQEANDFGVAAFQWPGYSSFSTLPGSIYTSNEFQGAHAVPK